VRQLLLVAAALAGPIGCTGDGGMDMGPPPPRAWPEVVSGGGGTLVPMRLVTLVTQGDPQQPEIESFGDALVASQWWTAVGADYHLDMAGPSMHMTGASLPAGMTSITRPQTIGYLSSTIAAAPPSLQPDGLTVYVLFLPPGVAIAGNESCNDYLLGYHSRYGTGGDAYAVVQHCQFQFASQLEQLTLTASHEVIEAATDPRPGTGWGILSKSPPWAGSAWAAADGATIEEVGDLCEGTRAIEGGFAYQRSWSVSAAKAGGDPCVPALPSP
jgi:hypothetical protein